MRASSLLARDVAMLALQPRKRLMEGLPEDLRGKHGEEKREDEEKPTYEHFYWNNCEETVDRE